MKHPYRFDVITNSVPHLIPFPVRPYFDRLCFSDRVVNQVSALVLTHSWNRAYNREQVQQDLCRQIISNMSLVRFVARLFPTLSVLRFDADVGPFLLRFLWIRHDCARNSCPVYRLTYGRLYSSLSQLTNGYPLCGRYCAGSPRSRSSSHRRLTSGWIGCFHQAAANISRLRRLLPSYCGRSSISTADPSPFACTPPVIS